MLLVQHGPCYFEDVPILAFGLSILLGCVSTSKLLLDSFLSKVCYEGIREVLFIFVWPKTSYMPAGCIFDVTFEFLKVWEHFTLLLHGEHPGVFGKVIDECDIVSASSERELDPTHLSGLCLGGLCLRFFLSQMVADVVCQISKLHICLQSLSIWRSGARWRLLLIASPWAFGGWYGLFFYAIALYQCQLWGTRVHPHLVHPCIWGTWMACCRRLSVVPMVALLHDRTSPGFSRVGAQGFFIALLHLRSVVVKHGWLPMFVKRRVHVCFCIWFIPIFGVRVWHVVVVRQSFRWWSRYTIVLLLRLSVWWWCWYTIVCPFLLLFRLLLVCRWCRCRCRRLGLRCRCVLWSVFLRFV